VINHNFMTDINVAASLHFLASVPNAFIMEYPVEPSEIGRRWRRARFPSSTGHAAVPEERGLGVGPDPVIIEHYLVRD
jgi:L-alanine-DL-glutamate epimerase-like enolase superfamily enzyme